MISCLFSRITHSDFLYYDCNTHESITHLLVTRMSLLTSLQNDLVALSNESKKKYPEIKDVSDYKYPTLVSEFASRPRNWVITSGNWRIGYPLRRLESILCLQVLWYLIYFVFQIAFILQNCRKHPTRFDHLSWLVRPRIPKLCRLRWVVYKRWSRIVLSQR